MTAKNKILLNKSFTDFVDGTAKKLGLSSEVLFNVVDELEALAKENLTPKEIKQNSSIELLSKSIQSRLFDDDEDNLRGHLDSKIQNHIFAQDKIRLQNAQIIRFLGVDNDNLFNHLAENVYQLRDFILASTGFKEGKLYSSQEPNYADNAEQVTEFKLKNQIQKDPELLTKTLYVDSEFMDPRGKIEDFTKESVLNRIKNIKENFNPEEKIGKFASELEKYIETKYPDKTGKEIK